MMTNKPLTIILHGLHQNRLITLPLARTLQKDGFDTVRYGYASLGDPIARHSERLHQWLLTHHNPKRPLNLVGHSLGGLIIRHFIVTYPQWQIHRCVSLGTPHQGSVCANYIKQWCSPLVGHAYVGALDGTCPPLPNGIEMGVIAGDKPMGVGVAFLTYHNFRYKHSSLTVIGGHDGTVYLSESVLENATDYLVMPVTHSQFLINKTVAWQVGQFLRFGKFAR
jgi:pimeloyl-ACP methyl ester carboxylesterase